MPLKQMIFDILLLKFRMYYSPHHACLILIMPLSLSFLL
jgi:hypothetical protein